MVFQSAGLALLLLAAAPPPTLSADQLVTRNLAARGGAAALGAIAALDFKGQFVAPGDFKLNFHELRARAPGGDRMRDDLSVQGLTIVQAYDGTSAWKINPFQGRKDAERMSADESRAQADASGIDGPLLASQKDGSTVRYLGREDYDGTLAYKLQIRQRDGDQYDYLLDPDSFLEIRATERRLVRGAPVVTEYEYGDYEKVGGVYFPMAIDSWQPSSPGQRARILIAEASANRAVDPTLFFAPSSPGGSAKTAAPDASQIAPAKGPDAPTPVNAPKTR